MAIFDDIKTSLRVTSEAFDEEIKLLIDSARADMERVGVNPALLVEGEEGALVKMGIYCYCKAKFGYDNEDAAYFEKSYRQTVADILNSSENVAAIAQKAKTESD